jgi:hypothetical protein
VTTDNNEIGRICPYALQQCTLAHGCSTIGDAVFGRTAILVERDALGCNDRGAMLFRRELDSGKLMTQADIEKHRASAPATGGRGANNRPQTIHERRAVQWRKRVDQLDRLIAKRVAGATREATGNATLPLEGGDAMA